MRSLLLTVAFALLGAPALASSIEPVTASGKGQGSIETISCADCPALKETEVRETYFVPDIEPGTQRVEIREVDGERKAFRSEAWLGGSPVVFVTKAPEDADDTVQDDMAAAATDTVDPEATTGALDASAADLAVTATASGQEPGSRELDPSTFELRVD